MSELNLKERKVALFIRSDKGLRSKEKNDRQERVLRAYANDNGGNEVMSYTDIGSGTDENRPALKRLLEDAGEKKIDTVLATDYGRLARSVFSQFAIEFKLSESGVTLIAVCAKQKTTRSREWLSPPGISLNLK